MSDEPPFDGVEMTVRGLLIDPSSDAPVVLLRQPDEPHFLPIWIGPSEAQAIRAALDGTPPKRPMTHDLMRSLIAALGLELLRLEVWKIDDGTFYGRLRLRTGDQEVSVDCRPSDGIALALRWPAPIWVAKQVLEVAVRAQLESDEADREAPDDDLLAKLGPDDLPKYEM